MVTIIIVMIRDGFLIKFIVGLPVGTWRITDLNQSRREEVCLNQHSFCVVRLSTGSYNGLLFFL